MIFSARLVAFLCLSGWLSASAADEPAKVDTPIPAFKFTAVADTLYSWNGNHPLSGNNQIRAFDTTANGWSLTSAALTVEHEDRWFNVRVDGGIGTLNTAMMAPDAWHGPNQYIQQAYFGFKPFADKPLRIEAGKFFSPVSAEVTETYNNFNTTRSLLSTLGGPGYHLGVRAIIPITKELTASLYLVNGWNNVIDNNSGKAFGGTATWTVKSHTVNGFYLGGPERTDDNRQKRTLIDFVYGYAGAAWWNNYTEFLWGSEDRVSNGRDLWYGFAHASRFNVSKNWSLSPRLSWLMDRNGATSGTAQRLIDMTGTVEYRLSKWIIARGEVRRDLSNRPFFQAREYPSPSSKTQDTALLGVIFLWRAAR